jgi:predicted ATPase/serine/threonine protein kinase
MAEVYRAKDTRLGRDVAIKVVSEALGGDAALMERFEREARLAASLNHPNVVTLHDVGFHDGKPYFVTELLKGETLRDHLDKGLIPLATALQWAAQMAQGLAAAHEHHVVHRDLKPENVFITRDGQVKLLDFGIAKLVEATQGETPHGLMDETLSPSGQHTATGVVVGTPGYMSPEQVRGDPVDERTDFFSLGAVLYEMLSRRRAFPAGSLVESGYAILHHEPAPLPRKVPSAVAGVVHRCLEKVPARRFQSARDLAFNLELVRGDERTDASKRAFGPVRRRPRQAARAESSKSLRRPSGSKKVSAALPRSFTALVGREGEVCTLIGAVASSPLVTITGPGGTGKTRVAIAVAESVPRELVRRVAFVDLAAINDPALVPRAAATALLLRDLPGDVGLTDAIVGALRDESVLVVIDNCEHLVEACAAFAASVLAGCRGVRLLATSQLPLGVSGEVVVRLAPLAAPPDAPAPSPKALMAWRAQYPALELLVQRLMAVDASFELTAAQAPYAAEICRRLDGLPLALELVAPRLRVLSLSEIAEQLGHRFELLSKGDRNLPSRQQGLTAVLEWSYGLLSSVEQRALERLSVFAGTFAYPAAAAVCAPLAGQRVVLVELLQGLVDKSFIIAQRAEDDGRRFRLLETVRHYALQRLGASGEGEDARTRLLGWAVALSEGEGRPGRRWHELVATEYDNVRVAFEISQKRAESAIEGLRLTVGLWYYWVGRGYHSGFVWLERSLACAPNAPAPLRAEGLAALAVLRTFQVDAPGIRLAAEAALPLALDLGDERLTALTRYALSWAELVDGKPDAATALADEALRSARNSGVGWVSALLLNVRSACASMLGDRALALARVREAFALVDEKTPPLIAMYLGSSFAFQAYANAEYAEARRMWCRVCADAFHFSTRRGVAGALEGAAYLEADRGAWAEAARLLGAAERGRDVAQSPLFPQWDALHFATEARVRSALGADFEREHRAGATLSFDEATELGLSALS